MNSVYFPAQIIVFIRRLVNVISTISLTNQYLLSRTQHDKPPKRPPELSTTLLSQQDPSWSWLISTYKFTWADFANSVNSPRDIPTDPCKPGHGSSLPSNTDSATSPRSISSAASSPASPLPPTHPYDEGGPQLPPENPESQDTIHLLMRNPTLFDPVRIPRYPLVLCHGLYGFDVRGPAAFPSLRLHYWSTVLSILKDKLGAEVIVTGVPGTGSISSRAENLDRILQGRARGRGINLMAHSMGGLDCRHLISHVQPREYVPLSLTSISTPHRGSPFMDWCAQYLGLGRCPHAPPNQSLKSSPESLQLPNPADSPEPNSASEKREAAFTLSLSALPSSFTTLLLSLLDSPAYANLTTSYLNDVFNPATPDDPRVKYFSVGSRIDEMNIWHPLWLPKMVLDDAEKRAKERLKATSLNDCYHASSIPLWEQENEWGNDGLVTVQSARWGEFLGILDGCDHWEIRGARGLEFNVDLSSVQLSNLTNRMTGDGSLGEWTRFLGAWRRQDSEKGPSAGLELAQAVSSSETKEEANQIRREGQDDPVVKASTDKVSAVFDWIVDHVPSSPSSPPSKDEHLVKAPGKHGSAAKFDLERFYIALTRKLYDEGL